VDGEGKKMSKALGNVIAPNEITKKYGAEILRLWTAAEDYREDIRVSDEILKRLVEAYRRVRNTFRFLLGNLNDFDPEKDAVGLDVLPEIDRYALIRLGELIRKVTGWYEDFEFHRIYHALHNFCVVDLSSLYLDVLKDRLYANSSDDADRRASQTVMWTIAHSLVRLVAPILSFTAEEVWDHLPKKSGDVESVHMALLPEADPAWENADLSTRWTRLLEVRSTVTRALETGRAEKLFGNSVDAKVDLYAKGKTGELMRTMSDLLPELFIVSEVALADTPLQEATAADEELGVQVKVGASALPKCPRCWLRKADVGQNSEHPDLCARCAAAIS